MNGNFIDFSFFLPLLVLLTLGRILLSPRMSSCRGFVGELDEGASNFGSETSKSSRNFNVDAELRSHHWNQFSIKTWQWSVWNYYRLPSSAFDSSYAHQGRWVTKKTCDVCIKKNYKSTKIILHNRVALTWGRQEKRKKEKIVCKKMRKWNFGKNTQKFASWTSQNRRLMTHWGCVCVYVT